MKEDIIGIIIGLLLIIFGVIGLSTFASNYNSREHSDDVTITEWISPDGVHYWYRKVGQQAMLAPRYDKNGELVIDGKE